MASRYCITIHILPGKNDSSVEISGTAFVYRTVTSPADTVSNIRMFAAKDESRVRQVVQSVRTGLIAEMQKHHSDNYEALKERFAGTEYFSPARDNPHRLVSEDKPEYLREPVDKSWVEMVPVKGAGADHRHTVKDRPWWKFW